MKGKALKANLKKMNKGYEKDKQKFEKNSLKEYLSLFSLAFFTILFLFGIWFICINITSAQIDINNLWWNPSGFQNEIPIHIYNPSSENQNNYSIPFTLNFIDGMNIHFIDISFYDRVNKIDLSFYISNIFYNSTINNLICSGSVKIPYIQKNSWDNTSYILKFNNSKITTSYSNPFETFIIFDTFDNITEQFIKGGGASDDITIDRTVDNRLEWTTLANNEEAYVYIEKELPNNFSLECTFTFTYGTGGLVGIGGINVIGDDFQSIIGKNSVYVNLFTRGASPYIGVCGVEREGTDVKYSPWFGVTNFNTVCYLSFYRIGNIVYTKIYSNKERTNLIGSEIFTGYIPPKNYSVINILATQNGGAGDGLYSSGWLDDILVRKYVSPEPYLLFDYENIKEIKFDLSDYSLIDPEIPNDNNISLNISYNSISCKFNFTNASLFVNGELKESDIDLMHYNILCNPNQIYIIDIYDSQNSILWSKEVKTYKSPIEYYLFFLIMIVLIICGYYVSPLLPLLNTITWLNIIINALEEIPLNPYYIFFSSFLMIISLILSAFFLHEGKGN